MSNSKHNQDRCEVLAKEKLLGKTITEVRYLTEEENEALELGFTKLPLMIWFSNYSYVFASPTDTDEGAAGTLLGGSLKTHLTWSFPPVKVVREDPERELTDDERVPWCPGDKLGGVCPGLASGVNSDCPRWKEEA